jgi:hypothetical protein
MKFYKRYHGVLSINNQKTKKMKKTAKQMHLASQVPGVQQSSFPALATASKYPALGTTQESPVKRNVRTRHIGVGATQASTVNIAATDSDSWNRVIKPILNGIDNATEKAARFILDKQSINGKCGYVSVFPDKVSDSVTKLSKLGKGICQILDNFFTVNMAKTA